MIAEVNEVLMLFDLKYYLDSILHIYPADGTKITQSTHSRKLGQTLVNKAFRIVSRIRVILKQMGSAEAAALNIIALFIVWLV